jgi:hypothetical protein
MSVPEAAAEWARRGWKTIPLRRTTKVPYMKWAAVEGLTPRSVANLFASYPSALLGVILGPQDIVLDLDHRPEKGWHIDVIIRELSKHYILPNCPVCRTPSGGRHLWFSLPAGAKVSNSTSRFNPLPVDGVDVRTDRGLIIVPPSQRPAGCYVWGAWQPELPTAPDALINALQPSPPAPPRQKVSPLTMSPRQLGRYISRAYEAEVAAVSLCAKGGRNAQLFKSAAALGSLVAVGLLPREHVETSLVLAAHQCGLVNDDGLRSVQATIQSGLRAGMAAPRQIPSNLK